MSEIRGRAPWRPIILAAALSLAGCTLPPLPTPTPVATPSTTPTPTPSPAPSATASPTPDPTPDPAAIPSFGAGEIVVSTIDGLRVRSAPGINRPVVTGLLPLAFELQVVMGPIPVDDLGWYLVTDADPREPTFEEGWVAAGYEPDPLLMSSGRAGVDSPYVASLAHNGDAEQGPIAIGEGDHAIRWVALDPERRRCSLAVSLAPPGGGDPVPAIRATVGTGVDRGTLQPHSFAAVGLRGDVFLTVVSDCAWALVIVRTPPAVSPSPPSSPSPTPGG